ncbi:hypothetical protein J1N35_010797 [Gossypium stocksii]|uniref:Retrotransposon Copia-like N-terminal domain-containing protein n=1 Tax=Gossypium stocksii TaxID=47602 RepID=A0A9D3W135_9ROSI|nr:hypothetical protein J1N35_010797 [Gossypium stocksii]
MAQSTNSVSVANDHSPPVHDMTPSVHSEFGKTRSVQSFPKHETIKLDEGNFIQWQQHIKLILEGYDLIKFVDGSRSSPHCLYQVKMVRWLSLASNTICNRSRKTLLGSFSPRLVVVGVVSGAVSSARFVAALVIWQNGAFYKFNQNYDGPTLAMVRPPLDQSFDATYGGGSS